jgi:Ribbon-helix-helix protein, copG family
MNQLTRCDRLIQIRAPEFLTKALDNAANKRLTSRSDYIRVALLDRLRADREQGSTRDVPGWGHEGFAGLPRWRSVERIGRFLFSAAGLGVRAP